MEVTRRVERLAAEGLDALWRGAYQNEDVRGDLIEAWVLRGVLDPDDLAKALLLDQLSGSSRARVAGFGQHDARVTASGALAKLR